MVSKQEIGQQRLAKWDQSIKIGSDFIYYLATTLAGSQTLGEEYADITTVHHLVKPSLKVFLADWIIFNTRK